jgi:phytoene dehydrogenase-like protein
MCGTSPENSTYQFWNDIIDMQSIRFVYQDTHCVVEDKEQKRIYFYSDVVQLEKELLAKAPEDKKQINELISGIKKFSTLQMPVFKPYENMTFTDKLKVAFQMLPYLFRLNKYVRTTNQAFAAKLKNPDLRRAFEAAFVGDSSLFYSIMALVWRHKKETGYPIGGAVHISSSIEKRYKQLGGKILFNSKVTSILVEDNKVKGIGLENDGKYYGDIILSAADGRTTIYDMLSGKFRDKNIIERYESKAFQTISKTLYVSLGINKDFSNQPHKLFFPLDKTIRIDPMTELDVLEISHYCFDPSAAPEGKSLLTLMPESKDWEYWYNLRKNDNQKYNLEKERVANEIIDALDKRFGSIKENLEMVDVVTPATYIHYTNNWTGGQTSWKPTTKTFGKTTLWQIKGLSNFYMTGQWASISGGLNNVVMMGNHLAQIICKNEGIKFNHTTKS